MLLVLQRIEGQTIARGNGRGLADRIGLKPKSVNLRPNLAILRALAGYNAQNGGRAIDRHFSQNS